MGYIVFGNAILGAPWPKETPLTFLKTKLVELQAANRGTAQGAAVVACSSKHAFDLMVLALFQHNLDLVRFDAPARLRRERCWFVMQLHA